MGDSYTVRVKTDSRKEARDGCLRSASEVAIAGIDIDEKACNHASVERSLPGTFRQILLALASCREKQVALAQKLLRELSEQYPASELFASEYAKVSSLPVPAAMVH